MTHFAEIDPITKKVLRVIVAEQDFINTGKMGDPKNWIQTSYNTYEGKHTKGNTPLRNTYAGIGYTYDEEKDIFIRPSPYPSWILNNKGEWESPIDKPIIDEQLHYLIWNEEEQEWELGIKRNV
jgi:hypothetical protein